MNQKFLTRYSGIWMKMNDVQRSAFNKFNEYVYFKKIKLEIVEKCFCSSSNFDLIIKILTFSI